MLCVEKHGVVILFGAGYICSLWLNSGVPMLECI